MNRGGSCGLPWRTGRRSRCRLSPPCPAAPGCLPPPTPSTAARDSRVNARDGEEETGRREGAGGKAGREEERRSESKVRGDGEISGAGETEAAARLSGRCGEHHTCSCDFLYVTPAHQTS